MKTNINDPGEILCKHAAGGNSIIEDLLVPISINAKDLSAVRGGTVNDVVLIPLVDPGTLARVVRPLILR